MKSRTHITIASEAESTVRIENISGIRLTSLYRSGKSLQLLVMETKQEKSELGFSQLELSCLKPSIKGLTDGKKWSQKSQPKY